MWQLVRPSTRHTLFSPSLPGYFFLLYINIRPHGTIVAILPKLQAMAANTNLPQPRSAIGLSQSTVEQLMPEFPTPGDQIKTYDQCRPYLKDERRKVFCEWLEDCLKAYPKIESNARMLPAFWARFQVPLGADESLAQDAALLTTYIGTETEPGTTWAPNVSPILQNVFCSIVVLSRDPSVGIWLTRRRQFRVADIWARIVHLARRFSEILHPVMEDAVSRTGKPLTPPYRLFRAILAENPRFMDIRYPKRRVRKLVNEVVDPLHKHLDTMSSKDKLSVELKKDIETIESLLRSSILFGTEERQEYEAVVQTWNSLGNLETRGGPTPDTNIPSLPPPSHAFPHRDSTTATPSAFRRIAPALTFRSDTSSQSMLYPVSRSSLPLHRVPDATYQITSNANATPQTGSTVSAPGRFPSTARASTLGLGTSTQSPLYPTDTIPTQGSLGATYPPSYINSMLPMATTTGAPIFANTHSAMGMSATPFRNSHSTMDMSAMDASDMDITATSFRNPDSAKDISAVGVSVPIMSATTFGNTNPTMDMSATGIAALGALSTPRPPMQSLVNAPNTIIDLGTPTPDDAAPSNTENPPPFSYMPVEYSEEKALEEFKIMTAGMTTEEIDAMFDEFDTRVHGPPSHTTTDLNTAIPQDPAPSNTENPPPSSDMSVKQSEGLTWKEFLSMTVEEFDSMHEDTSAPEYVGHDSYGF